MDHLISLANRALGASGRAWDFLFELVGDMSMEAWGLILGCMVLFAFICMRGFGSRMNW